MKQYEAVIQTLERLGGQATLAELYREVMKIEDCKWETKTPFASIRRIVQFHDLQDFYAQMVIVADEHRRAEFEQKIRRSALDAIQSRVNFLGYNLLVRQYEYEMLKASQEFVI